MYCLNSCTNSFFHTLFLTAPMEQWIVEWRNCKNPARLITYYVPDFDERDSTKHANILLAWTWLHMFAFFCQNCFLSQSLGPKLATMPDSELNYYSHGENGCILRFSDKRWQRERWICVGSICQPFVQKMQMWEKKAQKKAKQCIKPSKESSKTWGKREQHHSRKARKGTFRGVAELGFC